MIRSLLKIGLILVVGIVGYNYFFGTPAEKESSRAIIQEVKGLARSVGGLLKTEKDKFDTGKYDDALDKIGNVFNSLKTRASESKGLLDRISQLEKKKEELQRRGQSASTNEESSPQEQEALHKELEDLIKETEGLMKDVDTQE